MTSEALHRFDVPGRGRVFVDQDERGVSAGWVGPAPTDNPSGIRPTEFNVLFLPDEVSERTAGGIIRPTELRDREQMTAVKGQIIAISPLAGEAIWSADDRPQPGSRAIVAKHSGMEIEGVDGRKYKILKDKDILALCE